MKKFEIVAYSSVQYAPALCIWREDGESEAIVYGIRDQIRVGYMDDAGEPRCTPRLHYIYTTPTGRSYIKHQGHRHYIDDFCLC